MSGRSETWGGPGLLPGLFLNSQLLLLLAVYWGGWTERAETGASKSGHLSGSSPGSGPDLLPEQSRSYR